MDIASRRQISQDAFVAAAVGEHCCTHSFRRRPESGESAWQGTCSIAELLQQQVYPVWLLGPNGGDFDHHTDPAYHRILFRDALLHSDFLAECLRNRHPDALPRRRANIIMLHCTTCDHAAIIDGNHRLARLAVDAQRGSDVIDVRITGLSGDRWAADVPDMNKICRCLAP